MNEQQNYFTVGKDMVAYAPFNLSIGTKCTDFSTLYLLSNDFGKEHFRVNPDGFRVHFRVFLNDVEVALTDEPRHVFVAGTQFWSEEDTYSVHDSELDVTITAPHGYDITIDGMSAAIKKLLSARSIIDSEVPDNHLVDDGLQVFITVVSKNYCTDYTLFESNDTASVVFAACDRSDLGKIDGDGYQKDEFRASFNRFMDLHHMWIYLKVLLGYECPYVTVFNIGDSSTEWFSTPVGNDAK